MTNQTNTTRQKSVESASKAKNPMMHMIEKLNYIAPNGSKYSFYCRSKADMDPKALKWAFKLAEGNVGGYYKSLKMGWQPKIKQADINKNWARYLVALDEKRTPVAYSMFRFDLDYNFSVLYCYELQIEKTARRQGLGKFMLQSLEECAKYWQMEKVILTVLKNNKDAISFFKTVGYVTDYSSPDETEGAEYLILSKE